MEEISDTTKRPIDGDENADQPSKKVKSLEAEEESKLEDVCIVCMESNSAERPLLVEHQCAQCSKNAWKICACCNESILSRVCPVCRGNYAPIMLHVVPGMPLSQLADKSLSPENKALLLYKFGIIRHLIGKSNVAVWNPSKELMHFSLPQEFSEGSKEINCLTVSVPMKPDRIVDSLFTFNNGVWDEIENEVENGTTNTGVMMGSKQAVQWLLAFTRHEDHQILSMMTGQDWENMLDPSKSQDTAEALQSIQSSIKLPAPSTLATTASAASAATAGDVGTKEEAEQENS